jgi:RHS repeat-associated protein
MSATYEYDALDRLITATGPWGALAFEYDPIGNRKKQTHNGTDTTYDYSPSTNQLTSTGGGQVEAFTYDPAGRLTADGRGSYTYTPANLLQTATMGTGTLQTYRYDADGQRVLKIAGSGASRTYVVNGLSEFTLDDDGHLKWTVDYVSAGSRLLAAVRNVPTYRLDVTRAGTGSGTVTDALGIIACGTACAGRYPAGTAVSLTATVNRGSRFVGWSGACSGAASTVVVTMGTTSAACTATFIALPEVDAGDLDGDGKADVVWRNLSTGTTSAWFMNGTTQREEAPLDAVTDPNWRVVATEDFNQDGRPDLIWRDVVTGNTTIWFMDGAARLGWAPLTPAVLDPNWRIVGVGDFNGDGHPDIVWRHPVTGGNYVWYMNGATQSGGAYFAAESDLSWRIAGVADFNGDGKPDLLWRNIATGEDRLWFMDGITRQSDATVAAQSDTAWQVAEVADFNSDAKPDLVWRNRTTGEARVWFMNGATKSGDAALAGPGATWIIGAGIVTPPPGWSFGKLAPASNGGVVGTAATLRWGVVEGVTYEVCVDTSDNTQCDSAAGWVPTGPAATYLLSGLAPGTYSWQVRGDGTTYADGGTWWRFTVVALNDFNRDGKPDLVWRNLQTGANKMWFMNGAALGSEAAFSSVPPPDYQIVGTGDVNGDGKLDLVWRNATTGYATAWYMDGATCLGWAAVSPDVTDPTWRIVGVGDFNGDGNPDLLWRHAAGGNYVWYMNGTTETSGVYLPAEADAQWRVVGVGDFNGDGKPDIVWRHATTGQNRLWYMDGVIKTGDAVLPSDPDVNWQIVWVGDFNADGRLDLVWRNAATGANRVWYMDNAVKLGEDGLPAESDTGWVIGAGRLPPPAGWTFTKVGPTPGTAIGTTAVTLRWGQVDGVVYEVCIDTVNNTTCDTSWQMVGLPTTRVMTGLAPGTYYWQVRGNGATYADGGTWWSFTVTPASDFNRNGQADLLWRNLSTGANTIWFMTGTTKSTESAVDSVPGSDWRLVGTGDLNGDGKLDLVWRYLQTGSNTVWFMDGATMTGWAALPSVTDSNWRIVGLADFNADGKADIVWRHVVTGGNYLWYMDGATQIGGVSLESSSGVAWRIVGIGDVNGDAKPDLVWRNLVTGENRLWHLDGTTKTAELSLPADPDVNWQIVGVGDFNGDGTLDLVWRHAISGVTRVWFMDDVTKLAAADVTPTIADTNWVIGTGAIGPPTGWAFGKVAPTTGTEGLSGDVALSWGFVEGVRYELCVDTTNNGTCDTNWEALDLASTRLLTGLEPGTYYWQVRGNATTYADSGAWWSFTVTGGMAPQRPSGDLDTDVRVQRRIPRDVPAPKTPPPPAVTSPPIGSGVLTTDGPVAGPPGVSMFSGSPSGAISVRASTAPASGSRTAGTSWIATPQTVPTTPPVPPRDTAITPAVVAPPGLPPALADMPATNTTPSAPARDVSAALTTPPVTGAVAAVVSRRPVSGVTSAAGGQARPRAASPPTPATVAAGSRVGVAARDTFVPPASWQAVEYYHLDALGSVRAVTNDQGAVIARHDFLPFGEEVAPQNPAKDRKLFTGQERDFETGMDYFTARQLRPDLGRFLAPDPLAALPTRLSSQGFNAYGYVLNNPLRLIDPSGLAPEDRTSANPVPLALETSDWSPTAFDYWYEEWGVRHELYAELAMANYLAPLTSVTLLGKTVGITYDVTLSATEQLNASNALAAAAGLVSKNASLLTADEKQAIGQISTASVVGPKTLLGATGNGAMTLSIGYIAASSSAWLGSLFGHEGQHYLNAGKYSGPNLWKNEQSAGRTQLGIGNKIGFSASERLSLRNWIDDSNRVAMQLHMVLGYRY